VTVPPVNIELTGLSISTVVVDAVVCFDLQAMKKIKKQTASVGRTLCFTFLFIIKCFRNLLDRYFYNTLKVVVAQAKIVYAFC